MVEAVVMMAIIGILASIATVAYGNYREKMLVQKTIYDMRTLETSINAYRIDNGEYPASLSDLQEGNHVDRYGNPYQYLRIADSDDVKGSGNGKGKQRRDRNLNPINSDFDLYSMGKDGQTATQLNSTKGKDDIVRALNGEFIGLASDF